MDWIGEISLQIYSLVLPSIQCTPVIILKFLLQEMGECSFCCKITRLADIVLLLSELFKIYYSVILIVTILITWQVMVEVMACMVMFLL
jgi:hypothetical protein